MKYFFSFDSYVGTREIYQAPFVIILTKQILDHYFQIIPMDYKCEYL